MASPKHTVMNTGRFKDCVLSYFFFRRDHDFEGKVDLRKESKKKTGGNPLQHICKTF